MRPSSNLSSCLSSYCSSRLSSHPSSHPSSCLPCLALLLYLLLQALFSGQAMAETATFGPNLRVNQGGDGFYQDRARLEVGPEGNIYVTWEDWRHTTGSIYFARSLDGGVSFEPEIRVDPSSSSTGGRPVLVRWPCLGVDGLGMIYVAWVSWEQGETGQVFCARSVNQGASFETPVRVSDSYVNDRAWPAICGDPYGGVYLVWCDFRNGEAVVDLYTSRSNDGITFTANAKANLLSVGPTCTPPLPDIAAGDLPGLVHIVWRQTSYHLNARWIYTCHSDNWGRTFQLPVEVSHDPWYFNG